MGRETSVTLTPVGGDGKELIIKDKFGITLGRIFVIDISESNKSSIAKLKFYRENNRQLSDALYLYLNFAFNKKNLNKVNIIADEMTDVDPFIEQGFSLEGIISQSISSRKSSRDEFLFGIDTDIFRKNTGVKSLKLHGNNIILEILTPKHSKKLLCYYEKNREYLKPFEPDRGKEFYTLEAQRKIISDEYKGYLNGDSASFGIFKGESLIGKIRISGIVYGVFKNGYIGYSIDQEEQGKGYMKEAVKLVLRYAFEHMELHRIEAATLPDNIKSQRVLLACGFKEIGKSEKYLFINGKWRDHLIFAITNDIH